MKMSITRSCGHSTEEQLYGSHQERSRREAWLREQPCLSCQREAGHEMAREQAAATGLPTLDGTPKQVAWAMTIRAGKLTDLNTAITREEELGNRAVAAGQVDQAQVDNKLALLVTIRDEIATQASASWWIEQRNATPAKLMALFAPR